jgi:signal transduction histidine kinase
LAATLLALLTMWLVSWRAYRTSKRLVVPVVWLANVVRQWDPRNPDVKAIASARLPADAGPEVRRLAHALAGLANRVGNFVQREREFTRNASHELRTPLTVIRVATDMLLAQADLEPRTQRSLQRVQRAGHDMEAVIDAFLLLAREAEISSQSVDFQVRDVVEAELAKARPQLAGKPVEIELVDEGAPRLHAPPNVLAVMLGNLLGNAVRFTERGRVRVLLAPDRIEVRDTGIGMAPEVLAKVFDPFYRADFTREDGKGMGLSIVRRLAERVGWSVSLSSEPGEGTLATIHFVR